MINFRKRFQKNSFITAIKLKSVVVGICIVMLTLTFGVVYADTGASEVFLKTKRKLPIYGVSTEQKKVALTFDAAYGADKTEKIIEILKKHDANATFFLVGFWVDKYPEQTKLISQNGFEIATHSNEHRYMSKMSSQDIALDLNCSIQKIQSVTGKKPTLFRPPYGDYDDEVITQCEKLSLTPIQWSVDSLDWKGISGEEITSRVVKRAKEGSIILFHNNSDHVLDGLERIIEILKARGYEFCSVSDLIYDKNYSIDNNGIQIPILEDKK